MKKIFILIAISIFSIGAYAQSSHMALSMGLSTPLGDFASTGQYYKVGYAQPGFNLSFDGNYIPTWYFGIAGNLSFSSNVTDKEAMLSDILDVVDIPSNPDIPNDAEVFFSTSNWSYVNIMVGPSIAYPAGNFQFNAKGIVGMSIIMPPGETLAIRYDGQEFLNYTSPQTISFAYALGTDIIYKLNGAYSLKIGAEYFHTKAEYDVSYSLLGDASKAYPESTATIDMATVNLTIGLAYLF